MCQEWRAGRLTDLPELRSGQGGEWGDLKTRRSVATGRTWKAAKGRLLPLLPDLKRASLCLGVDCSGGSWFSSRLGLPSAKTSETTTTAPDHSKGGKAKATAKSKAKGQDTGLPSLPGLRERPQHTQGHGGSRLPPLPQVAKLLQEIYHARNGDHILHGDG